MEVAKQAFACDTVALSFPSPDESYVFFTAADDLSVCQVPRRDSICSHAFLLQGRNDVMVVRDMAHDWRFKDLTSRKGFQGNIKCKFYASAPIFLSSSQDVHCSRDTVSCKHVGRFSIFGNLPRPDFNKESCDQLLSLARMTEQATELEILQTYLEGIRKNSQVAADPNLLQKHF